MGEGRFVPWLCNAGAVGELWAEQLRHAHSQKQGMPDFFILRKGKPDKQRNKTFSATTLNKKENPLHSLVNIASCSYLHFFRFTYSLFMFLFELNLMFRLNFLLLSCTRFKKVS